MEITVRFLDFPEWLALQKEKFGDEFDPSDLAPKFIPYFETGQRIEVRFPWGRVERGYVGVTEEPEPGFILLPRTNSPSSSACRLKEEDEILQTFAKRRPVG